ncbi:MAG: right-handed parallel beta-helix repeat-containing protein, partial [Candidatus Thermoplasmatota archaeon]|nr:right-handed parallel beta-helix repeat-containing protein [Candidatus Thermoplasmatota archaeon]
SSSSNNGTITNCNVYNNLVDGVRLDWSSNNNTITNCDVYYHSYGIRLWVSSNNNRITNCDVYNNYYGVYLFSSSNNSTITNCAVYNNDYGITSFASSATISYNIIKENSGFGVYAASSSITIQNNDILKNDHGIYLDASSATISNNLIKENRGIGIYSTAPGGATSSVVIRGNQISENTLPGSHAFGIYAVNTQGSVTENTINGHRGTPFVPTVTDGVSILEDFGTGVYCENSPLEIKSNEIFGNVYGIVGQNTVGTSVQYNNLSRNLGKYRYFWSTHNITEEGEYTIGCGVRFENGVAIIVS